MAQVVLWQAGSGNENMMLRMTYTAGTGTVSVTSLEGARYDGYSTYNYSAPNGQVYINIGGVVTTRYVSSVAFNANSAWSTLSGATASRSGLSGYVSITVSFSGYGNVSNINNSVFTTTVLALESPRAPSGVTHVRNSDNQNTVSWSYGSSGQYGTVYIERSTNGSGYSQIATASAGTTSYVDKTTSTNQYHKYRVRTNYYGGWSAYATGSTTTYNTPAAPGKPSGARDASNNITLTFTNSGVTQTATEVQRSTNGTTWTTISTITGTAVKTVTDSPGGGTFYYRVRNTRGSLESAWSTTSDAIVTIIAPAAPTLVSPTNGGAVSKADPSITFRWIHNPLDGSAQTQAQIRYSLNGGTTWSTHTVTYTEQTFALTNSFDVNANVVWQVRTRGAHADYGPWSASGSFRVFQVPTVIIESPHEELEDMPLVVSWYCSDPSGSQISAIITLIDDSDGIEVYQKALGSESTYAIGQAEFLPLNLRSYTVRIFIRSSSTLTATAEHTFYVDYIPPAVPLAHIEAKEDLGAVSLTALAGSGTDMTVTVPANPPGTPRSASVPAFVYNATNSTSINGPMTSISSQWPSSTGSDHILTNTTSKPKLFKVSASGTATEQIWFEFRAAGGWEVTNPLRFNIDPGTLYFFSPEFIVPAKSTRRVFCYNPGVTLQFTWSDSIESAPVDFSRITDIEQGRVPVIYAAEALFISLDERDYLIPAKGVYRFPDFIVNDSSFVTLRDMAFPNVHVRFVFDNEMQVVNSGAPVSPTLNVANFSSSQSVVYLFYNDVSYRIYPGVNSFPDLIFNTGPNFFFVSTSDGTNTPAIEFTWTEVTESRVDLVNEQATNIMPKILTFEEGVILRHKGILYPLKLGEQILEELVLERGTTQVEVLGNTKSEVIFKWEYEPAVTVSVGILRRVDDRLVTLVESAPSGTNYYDAYPPLDQDFDYIIVAYTENGLTAQRVVPMNIPSRGSAFFNFGDGFFRVAKVALDANHSYTLNHYTETFQTAAQGNPFPMIFYGTSDTLQGSVTGTSVRRSMNRNNIPASQVEDLKALAAWRGFVIMRLPYEEPIPVDATISHNFTVGGTVSDVSVSWTRVRADGLVM